MALSLLEALGQCIGPFDKLRTGFRFAEDDKVIFVFARFETSITIHSMTNWLIN